jgi:hypothetical protein
LARATRQDSLLTSEQLDNLHYSVKSQPRRNKPLIGRLLSVPLARFQDDPDGIYNNSLSQSQAYSQTPRNLPRNSYRTKHSTPNNPGRFPIAVPRAKLSPRQGARAAEARGGDRTIRTPLPEAAQTAGAPAIQLYNLGHAIVILIKIYNKEAKYRGSIDDLNIKIKIFYDFCNKSGV